MNRISINVEFSTFLLFRSSVQEISYSFNIFEYFKANFTIDLWNSKGYGLFLVYFSFNCLHSLLKFGDRSECSSPTLKLESECLLICIFKLDNSPRNIDFTYATNLIRYLQTKPQESSQRASLLLELWIQFSVWLPHKWFKYSQKPNTANDFTVHWKDGNFSARKKRLVKIVTAFCALT